MNSLKSTLLDQLRGYVKLPDVEDQTEYNFSVRYSNSEDSKFFNVLGYQNKVYTLKRDVFSNVLRNVKQNYVLYLDGIRITSTKVYLVMMYCRSVVTDEIIDQVKYRSAKLQIAEIVNKDAQKSIKKLKYAGYVDLNRRYMKTDRIVSSIKNIAANKYHIGV